MMKSALVLALAAGVAAAAPLDAASERQGMSRDRVLADSRDQIRTAYEYRVGNERITITTQPIIARADNSVQIWNLNEPLFDTRENGLCPDAIILGGLLFPDNAGVPAYDAFESTAQFEANTIIDCIEVSYSSLDEPLADQGNGTLEPVPFNDLVLVIEDSENSLSDGTDVFTPNNQRFGFVLTDLAGDDDPAAPGLQVLISTVDLAGTGLEFELADDNGMAEDPAVGTNFNANSFLDSTFNFVFSENDVNSLSDVSYLYYMLQPNLAGDGQLDPKNPVDRLSITPQGILFGFSDQFALSSPLDRAGTWPEVDDPSLVPGSARAAFNGFRIWDLSSPVQIGGVDLSDPFAPEAFNEESSSAFDPGLFGWLNDDSANIPQFVVDLTGADIVIDMVCENIDVEDPANPGTFYTLLANGGSDPYIGFFGPGSGGPQGCNPADIAEPFGILDQSDIDLFISEFLSGTGANGPADIAAPFGILDQSDVDLLIASFIAGCTAP